MKSFWTTLSCCRKSVFYCSDLQTLYQTCLRTISTTWMHRLTMQILLTRWVTHPRQSSTADVLNAPTISNDSWYPTSILFHLTF